MSLFLKIIVPNTAPLNQIAGSLGTEWCGLQQQYSGARTHFEMCGSASASVAFQHTPGQWVRTPERVRSLHTCSSCVLQWRSISHLVGTRTRPYHVSSFPCQKKGLRPLRNKIGTS